MEGIVLVDAELEWAKDSRLIIITAHRRENLGEPMHHMFCAIRRIMDEHPDVKAIYPIHMNPMVRKAAEEELSDCERIHIIEPLEVIDFHNFLFYDGVEPDCRQNLVHREYSDISGGVEYLRMMRDDDAYWITAWSFLISRAFLQKADVEFCEGIICEDHLFAVLMLLKADRVSHLGRRFYHYRIRPNSITTTPPSQEWIHSYMTIVQEVILYGLSVNCGSEEAYELWRTVEYFQKCGKSAVGFINIGEDDSIFDKPFTQYLYKYFVIDSMKVDEEYVKLRKEIEQMEIQLAIQQEWVETLVKKTSAAEQSVAAAWKEVENIHRSATYRIGRVITWLPRMARGFVRCYREHGWRYTWHRVVVHLRRER